MNEKNLEAVMLDRILQLVDDSKRAPQKSSWLVTILIWVAVGVASYLVASRFGSSPGGRIAVLLGAFIGGVVLAYAVLKAWQAALWSCASRYLDADAVRRRLSELR